MYARCPFHTTYFTCIVTPGKWKSSSREWNPLTPMHCWGTVFEDNSYLSPSLLTAHSHTMGQLIAATSSSKTSLNLRSPMETHLNQHLHLSVFQNPFTHVLLPLYEESHDSLGSDTHHDMHLQSKTQGLPVDALWVCCSEEEQPRGWPMISGLIRS